MKCRDSEWMKFLSADSNSYPHYNQGTTGITDVLDVSRQHQGTRPRCQPSTSRGRTQIPVISIKTQPRYQPSTPRYLSHMLAINARVQSQKPEACHQNKSGKAKSWPPVLVEKARCHQHQCAGAKHQPCTVIHHGQGTTQQTATHWNFCEGQSTKTDGVTLSHDGNVKWGEVHRARFSSWQIVGGRKDAAPHYARQTFHLSINNQFRLKSNQFFVFDSNFLPILVTPTWIFPLLSARHRQFRAPEEQAHSWKTFPAALLL